MIKFMELLNEARAKKMKSKDLAKILLENPDNFVTISIDISKSDDNWGKRCFSNEIVEVTKQGKQTTIIAIGEIND